MPPRLRSVLAAVCAFSSLFPVCHATEPGEGFHVLCYELALTPNLQTRTVTGTETIRFSSLTDDLRTVVFSGNALTIDSATLDGKPIQVSTTHHTVSLALPKPVHEGKTGSLRIAYHGTPKQGVTFTPTSMVTSYAACDWMICSEDTPGDKAVFDLSLHVPAGMTSIASGKQIGKTKDKDGGDIHHWRTAMPYSTYLYDFAIGNFTSTISRQENVKLVYMSDVASASEMQTAFQETAAMVKFLSEKAGMELPAKSYTQLLVSGDEAQEAATYSIIGKDNIDPKDDWAIIHELAHQWWGNSITCATWKDFWLNEGFATFMTAAWKEHQHGQAGYDQEMTVARTRYDAVKAKGLDKPLAFPGEYKGRQLIQYSKGAMFLDHLRTLLGDEVFWAGIRTYTREHTGGTVTSIDFEHSMEGASGQDLSKVFAEWVFGSHPANGSATNSN
jgi:aminopeptidase N